MEINLSLKLGCGTVSVKYWILYGFFFYDAGLLYVRT